MSKVPTNKVPLQVMVTAFACNPTQGSEPGIGWGWVHALSRVCRLTVLTTTCNRPEIERALAEESDIDAHFIYLDVVPGVARLNQRARHKVGVLIRLVLWQYRVHRFLRDWVKGHECDVLHHLTLGSFRMPFSVAGHGLPSVVGPVGGCEEFPEHLLPEFSLKARFKAHLRNWANRVHTRYGWGMDRYRRVDLTLSCTKEMSAVFSRYGVESPVFPNIGLPSEESSQRSTRRGEGFRLLFVGHWVYWKGVELALMALQRLPDEVSLSLVGGGGDLEDLKRDVERLGLQDRVDWVGSLPRGELLERYADYDVFVFPSLHDSGGMCVLEAMRAGLPVVCLDAGGPGLSVTGDCGQTVALGAKRDMVAQLSAAIRAYMDDPELRERHARAAVQRVNDAYHWQKNAVRMEVLYRTEVEKSRN